MVEAAFPGACVAEAREQITRIAKMPFVFRWVAVMPDVHWGIGATVGSVIPTKGAVIPAAVGVDIGCGMMAIRTTLRANDLPDDLHAMRTAIENAVPHGRTNRGGSADRGSWHDPPALNEAACAELEPGYKRILSRHRKVAGVRTVEHLGTLGTGNHFIEVCLDKEDRVGFLLHSGSRGIGNRIGTYFIELAKKDMGVHVANLPDEDLAYLKEGTEHFDEYCEAVEWAQRFPPRSSDRPEPRRSVGACSQPEYPRVHHEGRVECTNSGLGTIERQRTVLPKQNRAMPRSPNRRRPPSTSPPGSRRSRSHPL
jgi:tRNA-splicing ligase RtcB